MLDCIHVCVFLLSKNCFEKLARHLLDTSSIPCYMSSFLSIFLKRNLDTSSIPGGSIEKDHASLIAPRHLLDRSSFCSESDSLFLDSFLNTSAIEDQILDTYLDKYLDTFICRDLLAAYIRPLCHLNFISLRSLSRYFSVSLLKLSHLTPNLFLKDSSSFFKFLLTWLAPNPFSFMHFMI